MPERIPVDQAIAPSFEYDRFSLPENVALTFHLNPHKNAGDLPEPAELDSIIRHADIVIPEFVSDSTTKESMARIAAGSKKEYDVIRSRLQGNEASGWIRAVVSALYASRTATANIDVSTDNPAVRAFMTTEAALHKNTTVEIRTHFDELLDTVTANFAAIKARDQQILENIAPEIERVIKGNHKLQDKRDNESLGVRIFYGSAHRSLLDAALSLQALRPAEGFSAQASPDSIENDLMPTAYGKYLRGQDITVEDMERVFAYLEFSTLVSIKHYVGENPPGRTLVEAFLELEDQLDTTDFRHLREQVKNIFES